MCRKLISALSVWCGACLAASGNDDLSSGTLPPVNFVATQAPMLPDGDSPRSPIVEPPVFQGGSAAIIDVDITIVPFGTLGFPPP